MLIESTVFVDIQINVLTAIIIIGTPCPTSTTPYRSDTSTPSNDMC